MSTETVFSADLAGIEVGETAISHVNGAEGELGYRGASIETLVDKPFWQVVWLVLFGDYPNADQENALQIFMANNSRLSEQELAVLKLLPNELHPMLMLQAMVPIINLDATDRIDGLSNDAHSGIIIASKLPSLIAAKRQFELGKDAIAVDMDESFHKNFLLMFNGQAPTEKQIQMLDTAQILQMEHGFNASTFAGRVCASTLAPIQSAIAASIATLYGELHGGADQAALEMAQAIGKPELAAAYVEDCLAKKIKIMGMGHREYKVLDPRAKILKPMALELCDSGDAKVIFSTLVAVEDACREVFNKKGKEIRANVEFYKGAVFYQLGVPSHYFTSLFAMARVYGYIAHYLEFSGNSRLIRPKARYVGK